MEKKMEFTIVYWDYTDALPNLCGHVAVLFI